MQFSISHQSDFKYLQFLGNNTQNHRSLCCSCMGKIPVFSAVMEIPTLKTGLISKSIRSCVNISSIENHNPNGKDNILESKK